MSYCKELQAFSLLGQSWRATRAAGLEEEGARGEAGAAAAAAAAAVGDDGTANAPRDTLRATGAAPLVAGKGPRPPAPLTGGDPLLLGNGPRPPATGGDPLVVGKGPRPPAPPTGIAALVGCVAGARGDN
jgi:hypothetical protein